MARKTKRMSRDSSKDISQMETDQPDDLAHKARRAYLDSHVHGSGKATPKMAGAMTPGQKLYQIG